MTPSPPDRPTLSSIAHATGVSRQTVSNVVNGSPKVSERTRELVAAEIARMGYQPDAAARQLRTRRSRLLGFRLYPSDDGINGSMLDRLLHALTQEAHERGYNLLVFNAEDDAAEIRAYEHLRRTNNMDGFLLTSTTATDHRTDWLREHDVPFVAFGRPWGREESVAPTGHDWIDVDGGAGTEDATLALLEKGRCHIAFLGWPPDQGSGDDRRAGWARALATVGIDPVPELERRVPSTFPESARAASQLIAAGADAIVCACDAHALGALSRAQVESPRLAPWIVGFDDTPVARVLGMSSIDQPIEASAARMIDLLLHRIEHPGQPYADESSTDLPLLRPEVRFRNPGT